MKIKVLFITAKHSSMRRFEPLGSLKYNTMRTPITYYGGKQGLSGRIIPMIPRHRIYCEPFFGGGAVFFAKGKSEIEVINDKNEMLINFYQICREKFGELQKMIQHSLHSEAEFLKAKDIYNKRIESCDVERAWALWILSHECHAANLHGGWRYCNGTAGTHIGRVLRKKREEFTNKLYERISEVQISCRDALRVIKDRDSVETFFYLDPPYPGACQGHYYGFSEKDLADLLMFISKLKGKLILSNYWTDTLRSAVEKYKWNFKEIDVTTHSAVNKNARKSTEVLVYNYELEPTLFSSIF